MDSRSNSSVHLTWWMEKKPRCAGLWSNQLSTHLSLPWWRLGSPDVHFVKVCVCVRKTSTKTHGPVAQSEIVVSVAPGRAVPHRSDVTGRYSVSHRQCTSRFWIFCLRWRQVSLTGSGWCWRRWRRIAYLPWNNHSYLMGLVAAAKTVSCGGKEKIKSNPVSFLCQQNECVFV